MLHDEVDLVGIEGMMVTGPMQPRRTVNFSGGKPKHGREADKGCEKPTPPPVGCAVGTVLRPAIGCFFRHGIRLPIELPRCCGEHDLGTPCCYRHYAL